jgi:hypothetical protein
MLKFESENLKLESENTASEILTDEQLEVVSGGLFAGPPWVLGGAPDLTKGPGPSVAHF